MKIKTFALSSIALACMSATPAYAEDDWVNVYGKIMLTLDKVDNDNGDDQWELNSNASRFGVKGKGKAGSLEAFYQLEWEVDVSGDKSSSDNIKARNQIVGLRGGFGEVFAGRHDTPTKKLQKKVDLFNDLQGDLKYTFNGEVRTGDIVQYSTPKMGGFKAKIAFVPGEETDVNDGLADGTSIALEYKTGGLNLGVSFDSDIEGSNVDTTRAVAQYKTGDWQFGFLYQDTENGALSGDGMVGSVKYKIGDNALKIQIVESDIWEADVSSRNVYESQFSLGWDKKLGKKTTFFTYLTQGDVAATSDEDQIFGIGIVQKF